MTDVQKVTNIEAKLIVRASEKAKASAIQDLDIDDPIDVDDPLSSAVKSELSSLDEENNEECKCQKDTQNSK